MFNWLKNLFSKSKKEVEKIIPRTYESATYENGTMYIKYTNGDEEAYKGDCTVWHKLPMMHRARTFKEGELCDIQKYIKHYGNPYPTAHLNKEKDLQG